MAAQRLGHAAAACLAEDELRPCNVGTPAEPRRRAGRNLSGCRSSRRGDTASAGIDSAPAHRGSGWCRGSRREPHHRVDVSPRDRPIRSTPQPHTSPDHHARSGLQGRNSFRTLMAMPSRSRSWRRQPRRCLRQVWSRLAARAVIGVSGIYAVSLYSTDHSRSATAAWFPPSLVHPVLLVAGQLPGGGLLGTVGVQHEKPPSQRHHGVGIDLAHRNPRRHAQQKTHLCLIQIPDASHYPLIEQGDANFDVWMFA